MSAPSHSKRARPWIRLLPWTALLPAVLAAVVLLGPQPAYRAEAWLHYRLTGYLPPPIVIGQHGRLFLGNHEGSPPGSLIADVCGVGVEPLAIARSVRLIRSVLVASRATGVPFRVLIVPTAPRIYPEDLPPGTPCNDPAADRVVNALDDPAIVYPVAAMQALKLRFDVLPPRHFHWAGEGPLRVAEEVADAMGLQRAMVLTLLDDDRASDMNGFYPGLGLHDRVGTPNLRAAAVTQCSGTRCDPKLPAAIVAFARPGPGRILVLADSFGDELAGNFSEYAGVVWLVRMNLALAAPPGLLAPVLHAFAPTAIVVAQHDAGALAMDAPSQGSLALVAALLGDVDLPGSSAAP